MKLQSIFQKPVDRPIEGVIKADDEESLRIEVNEYVLTNEVDKRLEDFLEAYNRYENANGVWLSGFFGSGKSHLLKMLALLLEDRPIDGATTLEMFLEKPEIQSNEILRAELKKAVAIPSKSILFNIDQKADVISKTELDALLSVFVKVFDETCGYYGKQGYIAQFERDLDDEGLFQDFQKAFETQASQSWDAGRRRSHRIANAVDQAYSQVTGQSVTDILSKYKADYKLSIEDFAEQINAYVEKQGPDFRLNFFVDEVGQYIADNVKLMTNLQTLAESLNTKCRGRAWIIVTAQEEMTDVIGEMGKQQANDFSKIQARFANRMKLTSANVDEVIQKRLLLKTESAVEELSEVYHAQCNNFKTLFNFADGAKVYKNFRDRDHFIQCYPFVPYQFPLFQAAIQSLSDHNAFEGKHSSVGERSMLGVFQQVAVIIAKNDVGKLATFDLMFEGLRSAIKSQLQQAISVAEKNLDNAFAVQVLKALFLVKYVKDFHATPRNLSVLLLDSFDRDLDELHQELEGALNLLEQQTYIQLNGTNYEFLTDDEKDVEEEIKNTEVESSEIADELGKIIFDEVLKQRKIRHDENGQDYPFSRKLDGQLQGREHELGIHVYSPFHENAGKPEALRMQSMGSSDLFVVMQPDARLVTDLAMYKKTEKYIRQNMSMGQQESVQRILDAKGFQNRERRNELKQRVSSLLGKADLFVNGDDLELSGEEPISRLTRGFHRLLKHAYPSLGMLRNVTYKESEVGRFVEGGETGLFSGDETGVSEAEQEVFAHIQTEGRTGVRTTLKSLIERFEKKPYGWYLAAILCMTAKLAGRGKIDVVSDSNSLEGAALERALLNTHGHSNLILKPQIDFTASQVRKLKDFYSELFDTPPSANEAKGLGQETGRAFKDLYAQISGLASQKNNYPFLVALDEPLERIAGLTDKPYTHYLADLSKFEDSLLDVKEDVLDPIRRFMSGPQKDIYDDARKFVQSQGPNFSHIDGNEGEKIAQVLDDPQCFKGSTIQNLSTSMRELGEKIYVKLQEEKGAVTTRIEDLRTSLTDQPDFSKLDAEQQKKLQQPFDEYLADLEQHQLIAVVHDTLRQFEENRYGQLLNQMTQWATPQPDLTPGGVPEGEGAVQEPQITWVKRSQIRTAYPKHTLNDETDVEEYVEALQDALMEEIKQGKKIQL